MKAWPVPVRRAAVVVTLLASAFLIAGSALAVNRGTAVECVRDGVRKRIEVVANPRPARICEVWYADTKSGWKNEIRWYAESDRGFCHSRADGFIATLARTGWVCDVIRKSKVPVETGSAVETDRNHDRLRPVGETRSDDSIPTPEERGGGGPAVIVPRPPDSWASDTYPGPDGVQSGPDQPGGDPSLIVPPPRR